MDDITLPMKSGSMDDIGGGGQSQETPSSQGSESQKAMYERMKQIIVEYDELDDNLKDVSSALFLTYSVSIKMIYLQV